MLKPLRHPTVFVLLTLALSGWLLAWSMAPVDRLNDYINTDHIAHRPMLCLAKGRLGLSMTTGRYAPASYILPRHQIVYEAGGVVSTGDPVAWMISGQPDGVTAAAGLETEFHTEDFGLLAPIVYRRVTGVLVLPVNNTPLLDRETAIEAGVEAQFIRPPRIETTIRYSAAIHDTLFAIAALAWLYALLMIPTWKLWRNLTPAQRRRNRHACPSCGYDRSATRNAPCPECGDPASVS